MFESLQPAPPDPILGLTEAFKEDPNPARINLGTGIYTDDNGKTPTLECISRAEKILAEKSTSGGGYLPMTGLAEYDRSVVELLFGADHELGASGRSLAAQTPGGTGGLRVAADFIARMNPGAKLWMSDPTWANHNGIFTAAGLELGTYPYYDQESRTLAFDEMVAALKNVPAGDVVLFHACCHNPSGMDPTPAQWEELAELAAARLRLEDSGTRDSVERLLVNHLAFFHGQRLVPLELNDSHLVRIEAEVEVLSAAKALHEEPDSHQEDHRERGLPHEQQRPGA